jgi:hypothetical protein
MADLRSSNPRVSGFSLIRIRKKRGSKSTTQSPRNAPISICLREATSLAAFDTFGPMAIVPADHHSGDLNSRLEAIAARQVSKHSG